MNEIRSKPMRSESEIEIDAPIRAAEIEQELEQLGAQYLSLNEPSLLERAAKFNYKDASVQKARSDRERGRLEIEEYSAKLIEEHGTLRERDKSIGRLDGDTLQESELRARLRERRMRRGRYLVLIKLPASQAVAEHRLRALAEVGEEIEHLERVIRRIERALDG